MRIIDCEQGSPEWFAARIGAITGSNAWKLLVKPRSKSDRYSVTTQDYIGDIVAETLTGAVAGISTEATRWGIEQEPNALDAYRSKYGPVQRIGAAIKSDLGDKVLCSPDALTEQLLIEIKCPWLSRNHIPHLQGHVKKEYYAQVQFNMWVTERSQAHFVSYDPRFPSNLQLAVHLVELNEQMIGQFEALVPGVLEEVDRILFELLERQ